MARDQRSSLQGHVILIGDRSWVIASTLADEFKAKGAQVVMIEGSRCGLILADDTRLSAAVLDSASCDLRERLSARGIPVILYTARTQLDGERAHAPIVRKPAPRAEVVARVEELLVIP